MTTRLWTCTACAREYEAEPLRCECGGGELLEVCANGSGFTVLIDGVKLRRSMAGLPEAGLNRPRR